MPATERSDDVLYFVCGGCGSELSVPVALHGVTGPCPCCLQTIRAPELVVPPVAVSLPPVDRRHESWQNTESIPVPEWMGYGTEGAPVLVPSLGEKGDAWREESAEETLPPLPGQDRQRLISVDHFPEGRSGAEAGGFQAKLTISSTGEPLDDSWRERHRGIRGRLARIKALDRLAERILSSRAFRMARVALLVSIGGLCAGLILFLKDRHWVLDLPWRPDRSDPLTGGALLPATGPADGALAVHPQDPPASAGPVESTNPFLAEDPSGLELIRLPEAPVPLPATLPGGAAPIASGKN